MEIRIAGTVNDSIVDGTGIRYTIFVQGCPHNCVGCHNKHTHDFNGGEITDTDKLLKTILSNPLLSGVTFSGGEPFCQAKELAHLGRKIKENGLDIITYTGFTFEELLEKSTKDNGYKDLIEISDYLIDGKFDITKKDYTLKFKGSSNQRTIDCKASLEIGKVVEVEI